jgi:hypothetical protein
VGRLAFFATEQEGRKRSVEVRRAFERLGESAPGSNLNGRLPAFPRSSDASSTTAVAMGGNDSATSTPPASIRFPAFLSAAKEADGPMGDRCAPGGCACGFS